MNFIDFLKIQYLIGGLVVIVLLVFLARAWWKASRQEKPEPGDFPDLGLK